ncbi:hypothetical protein IEQ34_025238 [Dendrobium chrysotoxum]|uniref:CN hydrolase domain-containing protein n=1 Tax=Dendrobium chrysotoxum TaxID=161865 RepID=A0AAV7FQE9_DENCH|nr:hypothetical protein IEQ34_025238 [Dendrobium chrysotoxum]
MTTSDKAPVFHSLGLPLQLTKRPIDLTLIQLGQTSTDKQSNLDHARQTVRRAVSKSGSSGSNTRLVVLPECWNSPYGVHFFDTYAEDFGGLYERVKSPLAERKPIANAAHVAAKGDLDEVQAATAQQEALVERWTVDGLNGRSVSVGESKSETLRMMSDLSKELGIVLVGGSIPERDAKTGKLYNTASVFNEHGDLISLHRKLHLFDIDIPGKMTFQESKTLTAGDRITVFECSLGRFGLAICYDLRFPECATVAARLGAGAMIYPGAFNTTTGPRSWELLQRGRAADNQIYIVTCSPARPTQEQIEGPDKAYPTYGFSMVVDPWGKVIHSLDEKENVLHAQLARDDVEEVRKFVPTSRQRRFDVYPDVSSAY